MNKLIKIFLVILIINIILLIFLKIYYNKLNKDINNLENTITFIDEGGGNS